MRRAEAATASVPSRYVVSLDGEDHEVVVEADGGVIVDGRRRNASLVTTSPPTGHSLLLDGASVPLLARGDARGSWEIDLGGRTFAVEVLDERQAKVRALSAIAGGKTAIAPLKAPMPGLVVRVAVEDGAVVGAGETVIIVEAMKMENELRAGGAARVARILVGAGDAVAKGQVLVEFSEVEAE